MKNILSRFRYPISILFILLVNNSLHAQAIPSQEDALLFYLSGEQGTQADYAQGNPTPNFQYNVSTIETGATGKAIHCDHKQLFSYWAPGNIYASQGTLSFFWRLTEDFTPTEFPIFRVSYADHTSWDMVWLRIDYNGKGFDAFVTDSHLARIRVSHQVDQLPAPNEWTHFALTWDENTGIRFYLNGKKVGQRDTTVIMNAGLDQFGPHSRIISPYQVQSMYNHQLGGDLDELRIYAQPLDDKQIAALAANEIPQISLKQRDIHHPAVLSSWKRYYGFETPPPYLTCETTSVRKVAIHETYDLKRWYWKSNDGIRETTWPGVYNRSSILGRNDYYQLPDWDCYSLSGWNVRFHMPEEPWNHLEITGGAQGKMVVSDNSDGSHATEIALRKTTSERTVHRLEQPITGKTLVFKNDVQETPISEFDAFYVHEGDAPKGILRLNYILKEFQHYNHPKLTELENYIRNRYQPDERQMLLAVRNSANVQFFDMPESSLEEITQSPKTNQQMPIVHIVIPNDMRDLSPIANGRTQSYSWKNLQAGLDGIRIELPPLHVQPQTTDGLFPINIQVKDPIWKLRNMFDFSFSVKPNEARVLWLDLRDRILPNDQPLYLTIVGSGTDFTAHSLKGMKIELVFKDMEEAKKEHVADRFTQIRDNHAMICEEVPRSHRYNKFNQIEADMTDLLRIDPQHELGRKYWYQYNSEQLPPPYTLPECPENIPQWAFLQLEVLRTYRELIEWYIDNRQIENGEFGGGISDDTDLGNLYPGLVFNGCIPQKATSSLSKLLEAAYDQGLLTEGMSTIQTDGLHTYEEGTNTICQMNLLQQGNPKQVERMMEAARSVRDKLLGINHAGHTHFRSDYFSATKIADQGIWTWSSNREFLHLAPALLLGEMYGNKGAREYVLRFADSMLAHGKTDERGRFLLPQEINFLTDEGRNWGIEYTLPVFWYAWLWTGNDNYLKPLKGTEYGHIPTNNKEQLIEAYSNFLRTYDLNEYIFTEGSIWTDRIYYRPDLIQTTRLGGVALNRSSRYVPCNPIMWKFDDDASAEKVAMYVSGDMRTSFSIDFFNTDQREIKVNMQGLEVMGGKWLLKQGDSTTTVTFGRGRNITLTIPPQCNYRIEMRLKGKGKDYNQLTDIAVGYEDIKIANGQIQVQLHNLSGKDTPEIVVALESPTGETLSSTISPSIPAPNDLIPQTSTVLIPLPANTSIKGCHIIVDPDNKIDEIYESNNQISL